MNLENASCVVLASSEEIIADIKTSLGLLKMEVRGARDATNAKAELLSGTPPVLALVEKDLPGKPDEGVKVAESIRSHPNLSNIPVCLLAKDFEEGDAVPQNFDGAFKIPVEFPSFTREVKKFFDHFDGVTVQSVEGDTDGESSEPDESDTSQVTVERGPETAAGEVHYTGVTSDIAESNGGGSPLEGVSAVANVSSGGLGTAQREARRLLDRRMVVAYGIQLAVLEELENDASFQEASAEDIPERLQAATEKVVKEFDITKLLGES